MWDQNRTSPKVGGTHDRIASNDIRDIISYDFPEIEHDHAVGQAHHESDIMLHKCDRAPLLQPQPSNHVAKILDFRLLHSGCLFIKQEYPWTVDYRPR
jgi:hypothetical protein